MAKQQGLVVNKRFQSWSFSRLKDYRTCPRMAAYKHLLKMKEAESPAMARGSAVHKSAEDLVLGKTKVVAPELKSVAPVLKELRALKRSVQVEAMWGFNRGWEPVAWDDWANCWLRVKMDVHYVAPKEPVLEMIDWKTGKPKTDEHKEQLKLYGVTGLVRYPQVQQAHGVLHYTDHPGQKAELTVQRRDKGKLIRFWEKEVKPMFADQRFAPTPGPFCRYCAYSKAKGGSCEF